LTIGTAAAARPAHIVKTFLINFLTFYSLYIPFICPLFVSYLFLIYLLFIHSLFAPYLFTIYLSFIYKQFIYK